MNMKKLVSLLLALLMVMGMATAFAEISDYVIPVEEFNYIMPLAADGSITVTNPVETQTYTAYLIFNVVYDATDGHYAYTIDENSAWFEVVKGYSKITLRQVEGTTTYVVDASNFTTAADAVEFAELLYENIEGKNGTAFESTDGSVSLSALPHGYYFVTSTMGSLCSLTTTDPSAEITEKNVKPTVEKEVQEDSKVDEEGKGWGDNNDADVGQTVTFKATITVQPTTYGYVLHDTMSAGLTYTGVTSVTIDGNAVEAANYTVTAPGTVCKDGCTFEVSFTDEYIATLQTGDEIEIVYTATLNENAVVGSTGNPNEVKLQYGDKTSPEYTEADKTITYTWEMGVIKYTEQEVKNEETGETTTSEVMLAGATFKLTTDAAGSNALKFHALGENKYQLCADAKCEKEHVTEITTDATGTFHIEGLDAGTYYLHETEAPAGYNMLEAPVEVVIKPTESVDGTMTLEPVEKKVENNSGTELPSTGGMGTTLLYAVGGVLVLVAFVLIVSKRRASEN